MSVAEKLRLWGLLPAAIYATATILLLAAGVEGLWLFGGVILAGMCIVVLFALIPSRV